MGDLLHCELVEVDGRLYRALYAPGGHRAQPLGHQQQPYAAAEATDEDWDRGGGAGGWDGGEEDEDDASVYIAQEGESYVARLFLDSEVGGKGLK